jgi:hypothetical protein
VAENGEAALFLCLPHSPLSSIKNCVHINVNASSKRCVDALLHTRENKITTAQPTIAMDLKEKTEKLGGNPLIRYAILFIGLIVLFLSEGILTWKRTAERDAAGNVAAIQFDIGKLEQSIADKDSSSEDKKAWRVKINNLKENDLEDASMEAIAESVDAKNGIWLWSMAKLKGLAITCIGLLIIAASGGTHEKVGALVALGLVVARL